jgi:hypothetical protein
MAFKNRLHFSVPTCIRDETQNLKNVLIFLRWYVPMGRRQNVKPRWRATGFSPKKIFGYAPKYALSILGPALKKIF